MVLLGARGLRLQEGLLSSSFVQSSMSDMNPSLPMPPTSQSEEEVEPGSLEYFQQDKAERMLTLFVCCVILNF